jgi:hypothetical protein
MKRENHGGGLLEHAALRACRGLLVPIARFLLRYGVGYTAFAEQAKWAFVHAALIDNRAKGRANHVSRIVEMTGLGRKETTRLRALEYDEVDYVGAWWRNLGDVLQRWHTEPDFLDARGSPLDLAIDGHLGFSDLVKRYGGDMSPSTVLRELRRVGSVHDVGGGRVRVTARALITQGGDAESVHHFGETLANVAATLLYNFDTERIEPPFVEKFVWADGLDHRARARFRRICADQGYRFLEAMDDWLSANCDPTLVRHDESLSLGVGIYYFEKSQRESPIVD